MNKNQIYGTVAICFGVALILPLLFLAVAFTFGNDLLDAVASAMVDSNNTFLDSIDGIGTSETGGTWVTLMGIGTIVLLVLGACLIALGIFLCVKKENEKLRRFFKPATLISGLVAIATAAASIGYVVECNGSKELAALKNEIAATPGVGALGAINPAYVIGAGTVMLIVVGLASIIFAFITKKFNPKSKPAVIATESEKPATTPAKTQPDAAPAKTPAKTQLDAAPAKTPTKTKTPAKTK